MSIIESSAVTTGPAWSNPPSSRRLIIETDYGQMHVRLTGEPEPGVAPLLLLHQTPSSGREWLRAALAVQPRQCIVPDLIGLGFSDPAAQAMSLSDHVTAIAQATGELTDSWVAVGHHTGAVVATALAGELPDATRGLGIIGYPLYEGWRIRYERLSNCNATHYNAEEIARQWSTIASGYAPDVDESLVMEAVSDKLLAGVVWYGTYVALWMSDLRAVLTRAATAARPTLVLAPDTDTLSCFAPEVASALGTEAVGMDGGARVLTEHPEAVAAALEPLLRATRD